MAAVAAEAAAQEPPLLAPGTRVRVSAASVARVPVVGTVVALRIVLGSARCFGGDRELAEACTDDLWVLSAGVLAVGIAAGSARGAVFPVER